LSIGKILAIILIILALVGVVLFLGYLGYNSPLPFNDWYTTVAGYIGNFDFKALLSNPAALIAGVGGAAAIAIPLYSSFSSKLSSAKQQLSKVTSDSAGTIDKLTGEKTDLEKKVASLTAENQQLNQQVNGTKNAVEQATQTGQAELLKLQGLNNTLTVQKNELQSNYDKQQIQYQEVLGILQKKTA
jgi:hypothetical protein